ncbi:MAG: YeeE/YedE family protein [Bdellovibrionales bacterium]|nr:YeeE/YedE family protein [Bdellovibrionales bacterium]
MINALIGGFLIGLAATLFLWLNGRVTGISGIINRLLPLPKGDTAWRVAFVAGLVLVGAIAHILNLFHYTPIATNKMTFIISGLLVGLGTSIGNGCTSGHGVCGISRFSKRSIVATAIFMAVAALTVFAIRHILKVSI